MLTVTKMSFLSGRQRHLGRFDAEVGEALVHVEGPQRLEVALQRLAGVAVVLADEGQPVRHLQLRTARGCRRPRSCWLPTMLICRIRARSPSVILMAILTLLSGRSSTSVVTRRRVLALAEVLVGQGLLDFVQDGPVEDASRTSGRSWTATRCRSSVLMSLLPVMREALDGRPFRHRDHQGAVVPAELDVLEEPGGVDRAHGLLGALLVELVADVQRQVIEDGALRDALQALDADVADRERILGRPGAQQAAAGRSAEYAATRAAGSRQREAGVEPRNQPSSREMSL